MRYLLLLRTPYGQPPAALAPYHDELARAGVLLDAATLHAGEPGWRVRHEGGRAHLVPGDGTHDGTTVTGYTLIQAPTREAAIEWSRRHPAPAADPRCEVEVHQLAEPAPR